MTLGQSCCQGNVHAKLVKEKKLGWYARPNHSDCPVVGYSKGLSLLESSSKVVVKEPTGYGAQG